MYGAEVLPIGESHCRKMRTALSSTLLGPSQPRNAALAMLAVPNTIDPQLELVLRAIRAAKRMCRRLPQKQLDQFILIASRHTGNPQHCKGQAACLVYCLAKLGWTFTHNACIQIAPHVALPLVKTNIKVFSNWALHAWESDVLLLHSDRCKLRMICLGVTNTRQLLTTFSPTDHYHLAQDLALSFQTEEQKQKWAHDATGLCHYCDMRPSPPQSLLMCCRTRSNTEVC